MKWLENIMDENMGSGEKIWFLSYGMQYTQWNETLDMYGPITQFYFGENILEF